MVQHDLEKLHHDAFIKVTTSKMPPSCTPIIEHCLLGELQEDRRMWFKDDAPRRLVAHEGATIADAKEHWSFDQNKKNSFTSEAAIVLQCCWSADLNFARKANRMIDPSCWSPCVPQQQVLHSVPAVLRDEEETVRPQAPCLLPYLCPRWETRSSSGGTITHQIWRCRASLPRLCPDGGDHPCSPSQVVPEARSGGGAVEMVVSGVVAARFPCHRPNHLKDDAWANSWLKTSSHFLHLS
jgi:hypothetical protein